MPVIVPKNFIASHIINRSKSRFFYRNFSSITAHKMTFLDLYRVHTTAPKWRTKTMPIGLPKTTQNSLETPQYPNNLSQKYNHDPIHVSKSNLTSKFLQYSSKPN